MEKGGFWHTIAVNISKALKERTNRKSHVLLFGAKINDLG